MDHTLSNQAELAVLSSQVKICSTTLENDANFGNIDIDVKRKL